MAANVGFNQLNMPAIDQAAQRTNANAFAMQQAKTVASRQDKQYDDATKLENTRWLAAGTGLLLEIYEKNPDRFYEAVDELGRVGIEKGILDAETFDPRLATPEMIQGMNDDAMVDLGANKVGPDKKGQSSRIQNYEFYAGLNPDERRDFQNANAASKGMKTVKVPMPDGTEIMVNYDPQSGQGYDLQSGETMIVRPGNGGQPMVYGNQGLIGPGQEAPQSPQGFGRSSDPLKAATDKKRSEMQVSKEFSREREVDSALSQLSSAIRLRPVIQRAADAASWNNTGFMSLFNFIPGLAGNDLEADIVTIKANLGFGELAKMRETSKTGGAVGQLSDRELTVLSSMLRNLDTSQTYEQLQSNIGAVLTQYNRWADAYAKDIAEYGTRTQFAEYYEMLPAGESYYHPTTMKKNVKQER